MTVTPSYDAAVDRVRESGIELVIARRRRDEAKTELALAEASVESTFGEYQRALTSLDEALAEDLGITQ